MIDTDFLSWYDLPPTLADEGARRVLPTSLGSFGQLSRPDIEQLLSKAFIASSPLPYHNAQHVEEVTANGDDGLEAFETLARVKLPGEFRDAVLFGFAQHDRDHPGATFFADVAGRTYAAGRDRTVEWHSSCIADQDARDAGFTLQQRLVVAYVIWSSTYGAVSERGRQLGLDRIRPIGFIGRLMRAADVVSPDEYVVSMHRAAAVTFGEVPGSPRPATLREWIASVRTFLDYVRGALERMDEAAGSELSDFLGWRRRVARQEAALDQLESSPVKRGVLRAELSHYHASLAWGDDSPDRPGATLAPSP